MVPKPVGFLEFPALADRRPLLGTKGSDLIISEKLHPRGKRSFGASYRRSRISDILELLATAITCL